MGVIIPCICTGFPSMHFKNFFFFFHFTKRILQDSTPLQDNISLNKYICFDIKFFISLITDNFLTFIWLTFSIPDQESVVRISKFIVFSRQIYISFHLSCKQNIHFEVLLQSLAVCWLPSQPSPLSPPFPQSERTNKCQRCHKTLGIYKNV